MKLHIDNGTFTGTEENHVSVNFRGMYCEVEINHGEDLSQYFYVITKSERSIWLIANFGSYLDELWESQQDWAAFQETWPFTHKLIQNGAGDKFHTGALIRFEDPDSESLVTVAACVVGNIDPDDQNTWFCESTFNLAVELLDLAHSASNELHNNAPSIGRHIAKGALAGFALGVLSGLSR